MCMFYVFLIIIFYYYYIIRQYCLIKVFFKASIVCLLYGQFVTLVYTFIRFIKCNKYITQNNVCIFSFKYDILTGGMLQTFSSGVS